MPCHGRQSSIAPPFARMIHAIHFTRGATNNFVRFFGGECTHCHKLNVAKGQWTIPSGPER